MKHQAKTALDQAGKSYGLMRQVSALEDKVSSLVTPFLLSLLSQLVNSLSVCFLQTLSNFLLLLLALYFDEFASSRYLLTSR
jgi:hypothetical protein